MAFPSSIMLVLCAAVTASGRPNADRPLTEAAVVELALQREPLREVIDGLAEAEQGRALATRARPLPQVTYLREQTYGTSGTGEDYLSVAQTIRLGGRPRVRVAAGDARVRAARHEGDAMRIGVVADARERFYDALHRDLRVEAVRAWIGRIDAMLAIVERREGRGDAAVYDRRRLERERQVASSRLELELAASDRAQARLAAITGTSGGEVELAGALLPELEPDALPVLKAKGTSRPDLLALDLQGVAARHDLEALSRTWLPDLRLEAGWKGVGMPGVGRADGFMLAAMLSFQPRHLAAGARKIALGDARSLHGQRALVTSEITGELTGARAEAVRLRRVALEFRAGAVETSADLVRIASVGYEGGELGLLEVLDAYRGQADDALTAIDLEHAAQRARIHVDRVAGVDQP